MNQIKEHYKLYKDGKGLVTARIGMISAVAGLGILTMTVPISANEAMQTQAESNMTPVPKVSTIAANNSYVAEQSNHFKTSNLKFVDENGKALSGNVDLGNGLAVGIGMSFDFTASDLKKGDRVTIPVQIKPTDNVVDNSQFFSGVGLTDAGNRFKVINSGAQGVVFEAMQDVTEANGSFTFGARTGNSRAGLYSQIKPDLSGWEVKPLNIMYNGKQISHITSSVKSFMLSNNKLTTGTDLQFAGSSMDAPMYLDGQNSLDKEHVNKTSKEMGVDDAILSETINVKNDTIIGLNKLSIGGFLAIPGKTGYDYFPATGLTLVNGNRLIGDRVSDVGRYWKQVEMPDGLTENQVRDRLKAEMAKDKSKTYWGYSISKDGHSAAQAIYLGDLFDMKKQVKLSETPYYKEIGATSPHDYFEKITGGKYAPEVAKQIDATYEKHPIKFSLYMNYTVADPAVDHEAHVDLHTSLGDQSRDFKGNGTKVEVKGQSLVKTHYVNEDGKNIADVVTDPGWPKGSEQNKDGADKSTSHGKYIPGYVLDSVNKQPIKAPFEVKSDYPAENTTTTVTYHYMKTGKFITTEPSVKDKMPSYTTNKTNYNQVNPDYTIPHVQDKIAVDGMTGKDLALIDPKDPSKGYHSPKIGNTLYDAVTDHFIRYRNAWTDTTPEHKTVTQHVTYVDDKGAKVQEPINDKAEFTRNGQKNEETGAVKWDAWNKPSVDFAEHKTPVKQGYLADKATVAKKTIKPGDANADIKVTYKPMAKYTSNIPAKAPAIDYPNSSDATKMLDANDAKFPHAKYVANMTPSVNGKALTPVDVKDLTKGYKLPAPTDVTKNTVITYAMNPTSADIKFEDANGQVIKETGVETSKTINGHVADKLTYTTDSTIKALQAKGWELVSDGVPKNSTLEPEHKTYVVKMKEKLVNVPADKPHTPVEKIPGTDANYPKGVDKADLNSQSTQTIKYNKDTGEAVGTPNVQTVKWSRDAVVNAHTGKVTYNAYKSLNGKTGYGAVTSPSVKGWVASTLSTPEQKMVNPGTKDSTIEVMYTRGAQKGDVTFIDKTTGKEITKDGLAGKTGQKSDYDVNAKIKNLEAKGYELKTNSVPKDGITFDDDEKVDQHYTVELTEKVVDVDSKTPKTPTDLIPGTNVHYPDKVDDKALNTETKQTITYHKDSGEEVAKPNAQSVKWTRNAKVNAVTGQVTYSDYKAENEGFKSIKSPVLKGWVPSVLESPEIKRVEPGTKDSTIDVTYARGEQKGSVTFVEGDDELGKDGLVGKTGEKSDYDVNAKIKDWEAKGYEVKSNNVPKDGIVFDDDDKVDQDFKVELVKKAEPVKSDDKTPDEPETPDKTPTTPDKPTEKEPADTDVSQKENETNAQTVAPKKEAPKKNLSTTSGAKRNVIGAVFASVIAGLGALGYGFKKMK